jgi:hypothetical protein
VVLLDGKPVPKAQVRFIPSLEIGPEYIAVGVTDDAGKFELECNGQSGACACPHIVTVSEADFPAELLAENKQVELAAYRKALVNRPIPPRYASPVNNPLSVTVLADQPEYTLELER